MEEKIIKSRKIYAGGAGITNRIEIGGDAPVSIQTMWKESIVDIADDMKALHVLLKKINELNSLGCSILRFAVPDLQSAASLVKIAENTQMPLVADIHFDYKLALACLKGNVAAIRINPGNIGSRENVEKVVNACKEKGAAIRIGINTGSLPKDIEALVELKKITRAQALSEAASREIKIFNELNFDQVAVSMKASSVNETVEANETFAKKYDTPLHIGVTEAGPLISGIVKSTLAFSTLLKKGIGNTIRVSLSSSPENEVIAGKEILRECGIQKGGISLISCPRCGRIGFDVHSFVAKWQNELFSMKKDISIAVMGCIVNGPGEGKHADLGIAGNGNKVVIFKKGKIVQTIDAENADKAFREELNSL